MEARDIAEMHIWIKLCQQQGCMIEDPHLPEAIVGLGGYFVSHPPGRDRSCKARRLMSVCVGPANDRWFLDVS